MKLKNKKIHFIGIGGISMSALASLAISLGCEISGSDKVENEKVKEFKKLNYNIFIGHKKENVHSDVDCVVYTSAIPDNNEELICARCIQKPVYTRAEFLQIIASNYQNVIAVAGSHGKTTTTAMLAHVLLKAKLNPTVHLGGDWNFINGNYFCGGKEYFITEACEYQNNFLKLYPHYAIITNIDWDHVDTYPTKKQFENAFAKFCSNINKNGILVFDNKYKSLFNCVKTAKCGINYDKTSKNCVKNIKKIQNNTYCYDLLYDGNEYRKIKLGLPGKFNVYNSAKVVMLCLSLGISIKTIRKALNSFKGVQRRFEKIGTFADADVVIDYAHHPTEIKCVLEMCKDFTKGKIYCVFQSHTFSRTQKLWSEFANCFSLADEVVIYPIYSAREKPIDGITADNLAKAINACSNNACYCDSFENIKKRMLNIVNKKDLILILGAGDIYNLANYLCEK